MTKPQQLTTTYAAQAGSNSGVGAESALFRDIPNYGDASPDVRAKLDEIIAEFDKHDPESGINFANGVLDLRNEIADKIINAQSADRFSFIREPMQGAVDFIREGGFQNLLDRASNVVSKGGAIARRNPLLLAGAAGLSFISIPVALVAGATAIGLREKARQLKQEGQPKSVEQLETEIREGIIGFAPMLRNLETAKMQIPTVRAETNVLGKANVKAFTDLTLCISAGREILRRLQQEDSPQAESKGNVDDVRVFSTNSQNLHQKLAILMSARLGSIRDVTVLANLVQTFADLEMSITSILTYEAKDHRASLAVQGMSLEALRIGRLQNEFREMTEKGASNAIEASNRARELAASGRVDSPERIKAQIEQMTALLGHLESGMKVIPVASAQQLQLQNELGRVTEQVVDAQVRYAQMVGANSNSTPVLPVQDLPKLEQRLN